MPRSNAAPGLEPDSELPSGRRGTVPPVGKRPGSKPPRWRRIALWVGAGLLLLCLGIAAFLAWVVTHLDSPSIKARVQALAHDSAGLDVDYDALTLTPGEGLTLHLRGLRVLQPPKLRAAAREFVTLDDLQVQADPSALLSEPRTIRAVQLGQVAVTLVTDANGATTLSELFPTKPDEKPASPMSQSLADLPALKVETLGVAGVSARTLELRAAGSLERTLGTLGLSGTVHSQPHSLQGTELSVRGVPSVRFEQRDGQEQRTAQLALDLRVRADAPESLAVTLQSQLEQQSFVAKWQRSSELLRLAAQVGFDPAAGHTNVVIPELHVLAGLLSASASVKLLDGSALQLIADGKLALAAEQMPIEVPGVSLRALALDVDAKQLAWQGDRLSGSATFRGGVQSLALSQAGQSAAISGVTITGAGKFDGPSGEFKSELGLAQVALNGSPGKVALSELALGLNGSTHVDQAGQHVAAVLTSSLGSAALQTLEGERVGLQRLRLQAQGEGTAAQFAAKQLPKLTSTLEVAQLDAAQGGKQNRLERAGLTLAGAELAQDATSPSGARGSLDAQLSLPSVRVLAARGQPLMAANDLQLNVKLPLSLAQAAGELTLASFRASDQDLKGLSLHFDLREPLHFQPEQAGPAKAELRGQLKSLRSAEHRGALNALELNAQRLDKERYRVQLHADASQLSAAGRALPGHIQSDVQAEATPKAGKLNLTAAVRGAGDAAAKLDLTTDLLDQGKRLQYQATFGIEKLNAFASLIAGAAPGAAALKLESARLHAEAEGNFTGVVHTQPHGLPLVAADPASTARGQQSVKLAITQLDYRTPELSVLVPKLDFELQSSHREGGAGNAELRLKASTLRYDGGGKSIHAEGLDQHLRATFDRSPAKGVVDVHTKLSMGSLAQSFLPEYKVAGLTLESQLQVDQLRSIFVRKLDLDNPASGTGLHASGALELRAQNTGDPVGTSEQMKTIVGREALAFEGSFVQALAPLQQLGFLSRAQGSISLPFRLESGGLLDYRLLATLEAKQVSVANKAQTLAVEDLNGVIPIVEELALLATGPVLSASPRASPLTETRFFDVHPFLNGTNYVTARSITMTGLTPLGPLAANVRLDRSELLIDQLQVGWSSGQIVGQVRMAYRDGDPLVRMRLNATGLRTSQSNDVFDANAALNFVPNALTLDGKVQLVRVSRAHLLAILDAVDPYHELASANRVRLGLNIGYPKFVRFSMHDGAVDTKVDLGGAANVVRIDEIKAVPLGPIMQRYVAPSLAGLKPTPPEPATEPAASKESK